MVFEDSTFHNQDAYKWGREFLTDQIMGAIGLGVVQYVSIYCICRNTLSVIFICSFVNVVISVKL
uniref:Uncharacterized protein n=1 Tax=Lotus japonicus TaxID=34305 RepID=I3SIK5_LOTJA|nr:unknown [Lotus japonicus]AFK40097.1 unknown [Lotus japonicus]